MDIIKLIELHIETINSVKQLETEIKTFGNKLIETIKNQKKVIVMGNGGSAADSQHIAAEIVGRFLKERRGLPAIALSTDTSIITALANDYSYDYIFKRQIEAHAVKGDLVIGISTSGNSNNIIEGIIEANNRGCFTVGLLGKDGGKLKNLVKLPLIIKDDYTPRIQEAHMMIYHIVCGILDEAF